METTITIGMLNILQAITGLGERMKPESLTQTLGWRTEYLRHHVNNWTQAELADLLSKQLGRVVSQGYISKVEQNRIDPPSKVVAALARIFRANGNYLLDGLSDDPTLPQDTPDTDVYMSEEAGEAASIIDSLAPGRRQEMVRILSAAAQAEQAAREERAAYYERLISVVEKELGKDARDRLEKSLIASVTGSDAGGVDRPMRPKPKAVVR